MNRDEIRAAILNIILDGVAREGRGVESITDAEIETLAHAAAEAVRIAFEASREGKK